MARKIVLDVDTGIDDALALLLALRSPELDVIGVTCVAGNITIDHVTRNTLAVLELAGARVPVYVGARKPLMSPLRTATVVHGRNGIGDVVLPTAAAVPEREHAPTYLSRITEEQPDEITIVAVGPLTNIALAILRDANFAHNVEELVIMGGAVGCPGNASAAAEANFLNDPEAAAAVAASGARIRLVDLGATSTALLPLERIEQARTANRSSVGAFSAELLSFYGGFHARLAVQGAVLHDPLAVALAAVPNLAVDTLCFLTVETGGTVTRGASLGNFTGWSGRHEQIGDHIDLVDMEPTPFNATVAREVDVPRFLDLFLDRLDLR